MENEELKPCLNKVKPTGEQYTLIHKRSILHGITDLLDMTSMIHNETVNGDQCMQYVAKRTDVAYRMGFITAWNTRPSPWIPITPETMPKKSMDVFVRCSNGHIYVANFNPSGNTFRAMYRNTKYHHPIDYMPIPPLPGK